MGLDVASVKFLFAAKSRGVDFSTVVTIGRQFFTPDRKTLQRLFDQFSPGRDAESFLQESNGYGDKFYQLLGAKEICSVDASPFEGATHVHDLNTPIPDDLKDRFSVVHDGGTTEHVFNYPQAIKNCMEMVRVGGHFLQVTVANNCVGHGFYQFAPELIFRVFSEENGFAVEAVLLHEITPGGRWFRALDPRGGCHSVPFVNRRPTYILTLARRTARTNVLATYPNQSYYTALWQDHQDHKIEPAVAGPAGRFRWVKELIPARLMQGIKSAVAGSGRAARRGCIQRVKESDLILGKLG